MINQKVSYNKGFCHYPVKIILKAVLLFVLLITAPLGSCVQDIEKKQIKEVKTELQRFEMDWQESEPFDSRFGIIQLLSLLNLDYPGLEKVKEAANIEDWEDAEQQLLNYFKHIRIYDKPGVENLTDEEIEASENALIHRFRGNKDAHPLIFRGGSIDWTGPAFDNGKEIKDREWQFIYQRLLWWEALAKAYDLSGDDKYYSEWQYEMVDFARKNLPIASDAPWFVRRGMENYFRCLRLSFVLPFFIENENFNSKTLCYFLTSFHMQAEHIRTVYAEDGNHLLGELSTVFKNGINFPEFKKSGEWIQEAVTGIPERMFIEIFPDGMNNELIFSYHGMYLRLFTDAYVEFNKYGYSEYLPEEYYDRLVKMAEIYMYQTFPDNTICQFGDAWKFSNASKIFERNVSRFAPNLPYYDFVISKGTKGNPPPKCNVSYPVSGFYFFRSEWAPDAVFMAMKNTPGYAWHSQIDNGTFELYALGRNFMNDSGAYIYESDDDEETKWRQWFRSSIAHQTLTLDERDIILDPKHIFWKESENIACLVNENQSYEGLNHRRTTLFIDNRYFLIYDQAIGDAEGKVQTHFQLVPCDYMIDEENHIVRTQFKDGPNLLVKNFPLNQNNAMEEEEGWISYNVLRKEKRPAWSYSTQKTSMQKEISFLTALIPYGANQDLAEVNASVNAIENVTVFTLNVDSITYQIKLDTEKEILEITDRY